MMISILMPVYNTAHFLPECLDSIFGQTATNWELLAVDDSSSDASWAILSAYAAKDARIRVFRNKEKGIIPALRLAWANSKGLYITRMDSDDRMLPTKLATLQSALETSGTGHVATAFVRYFAEGGVRDGYRKYEAWLNALTAAQHNFSAIYKECVIPSPCWMLHRADLMACGAFDRAVYPEDYDLCFRFYAKGLKVIGCGEILHEWRDYPTRTSRTDPNYKDNRFLAMKLDYFLQLDYVSTRPLCLWGAGRKGKQLAKDLAARGIPFMWYCNQASKWGHRIHGVVLQDTQQLSEVHDPQIIVAVASPDGQAAILTDLNAAGFEKKRNYCFFC